jgi:hypothetical protein
MRNPEMECALVFERLAVTAGIAAGALRHFGEVYRRAMDDELEKLRQGRALRRSPGGTRA